MTIARLTNESLDTKAQQLATVAGTPVPFGQLFSSLSAVEAYYDVATDGNYRVTDLPDDIADFYVPITVQIPIDDEWAREEVVFVKASDYFADWSAEVQTTKWLAYTSGDAKDVANWVEIAPIIESGSDQIRLLGRSVQAGINQRARKEIAQRVQKIIEQGQERTVYVHRDGANGIYPD